MTSSSDRFKLDRTAFDVTTREEAEEADRRFWQNKTPLQRLQAVEMNRQIVYGYDPATVRLPRVIELTERKRGLIPADWRIRGRTAWSRSGFRHRDSDLYFGSQLFRLLQESN